MSDLYLEELIMKKKTLRDKLIIVGLLVLTFFLWVESYLWGSLVYLIPAFLLTGFDFFFLPRLNVEWEYTYVDAELDVDKIFNRSKRKRIGSYEIKKAEIIAPVNSHRLDYYNNNQKLKVLDCTSGNPERAKLVYAMIIESDKKGMLKVLFEPSQGMVNDMRLRAPRTVFMD